MSSIDRFGWAWPGKRPYVGAALLIVGGVIVGYVPVQFAMELLLIGGVSTMIGVGIAALITLAGIVALLRPGLAPLMGVAGIVLSFLSVVGALGGFLVGLVVTQVGGILCIVWWLAREIRGEAAQAPG